MKTRFFSTRWAFSLGKTSWLGSVHHSLGSEVGYRRKSLRYFRLWIQDSYYGQQLSLQTLNTLSSGSSFPTMDGTRHPPALQEQNLNHWSAREVWSYILASCERKGADSGRRGVASELNSPWLDSQLQLLPMRSPRAGHLTSLCFSFFTSKKGLWNLLHRLLWRLCPVLNKW